MKRYNDLASYYKNMFGEKVFKISLNANFACPTKCLYCSPLNSGEFAGKPQDDLKSQFKQVKQTSDKWNKGKYIAYFQAGTNTFAPLAELKAKYEEALGLKDVVGLAIATRSDCISSEILDYLAELNKQTFLIIELGLQTTKESSLKFIKRNHDLTNFAIIVKELKKRKIKVVVHIINGLPQESKEDMLKTIKYLNELGIDGIKIQMLQILKNTPLATLYKETPFPLLTLAEYVDIVCDQLEILDPNIVVHRLTGDPKQDELIAPCWLSKKVTVLNAINKELKKRKTRQGINS